MQQPGQAQVGTAAACPRQPPGLELILLIVLIVPIMLIVLIVLT
jgi:hypothetical protein